ncbi:MAG: hypothetical protein CMJ18_05010 [Phycisphaeraceae bacterium]|nr:hypothetical protein [Phycisphaeraceae bacterium]
MIRRLIGGFVGGTNDIFVPLCGFSWLFVAVHPRPTGYIQMKCGTVVPSASSASSTRMKKPAA